jgi:hypothetical protein
MSRELVGYFGGVMIDGGSETTSSWMQTLVLAMVSFPEAQKKAQVLFSLLCSMNYIDVFWYYLAGRVGPSRGP